MKHKHYDVIVAWANGATIQSKRAGLDFAHDKWEDVTNYFTPNWNSESFEFRIKPEKKGTVGYRRYVMEYDDECFVYCYHWAGHEDDNLKHIEKEHTFVKWLDTDWVTHEIEE